MASPQKENGFTPIANEIIEQLVKGDLLGSELALILLVIRKTYGYHKKEDCISLTQFEQGLGLSRHTVIKTIRNLVYNRMLVKGGSLGMSGTLYKFNKNWHEWVVKGGRLVQNNDRASAKIKQKVVKGGAQTKETTKDNKRYLPASAGTPKGKNMKYYDERKTEENYEPVIDAETGMAVKAPKRVGVKDNWQARLLWSAKRRGGAFLNVPKQYKAFHIMDEAKIPQSAIKDRWLEMEEDKFWQEKGYDWMDVANSFNKRPWKK